MAILEVNNLKKVYTTRLGGNQVEALKNLSFSVECGNLFFPDIHNVLAI